jgi:hypothetical protein
MKSSILNWIAQLTLSLAAAACLLPGLAWASMSPDFVLKGMILNIEETTATVGISGHNVVRVSKKILPADLDLGQKISVPVSYEDLAKNFIITWRAPRIMKESKSPSHKGLPDWGV